MATDSVGRYLGAGTRQGFVDDAHVLGAAFRAPSALLAALGHGAVDFAHGFANGASGAPVVHPAIAAAMNGALPTGPDAYSPAATQAHTNGQAMTAQDVLGLGALSPAARAVLQGASPKTLAAADAARKAAAPNDTAALQGVPTWAQMMAGYAAGHGGNISLRAMDALAGASQKGAAAGSAARKMPSIADVAGAQALQLGQELFEQQKAQAAASGDKSAYLQAVMEHQDRLERLARARAVDPVAAAQLGADGN